MNRTRTIALCAALLAGALAGASRARADWPSTPDAGVPVCVATGTQGPPVMIGDRLGGAYLAWFDGRLGFADLRIYAQHLDALGDPAYDPDGTPLSSSRAPGEQPALVSGAGDDAFAVWRDFRADTAGNLYAQHLLPNDPAAWGADGVPVSSGPLHEREMSAASDGAGGLFVVWCDDRDGPSWQVRVQRVASNGGLLWDEAGIVAGPNPALQTNPRVVPDGEGGAIVAWTDSRGLAANVYAQHLSGDGVAQWTASGVLLSTATHGVTLASLAADGRSGAFAGFFDYRSLNSWPQAFAQHVDRTGALVWPSDGLSLSGTAWPIRQVDVCADDAGGAFIAWRDYENNGSNVVFAAHADSAGSSAISATIGTGYDGSGFGGSALAPDGEGGALLVWNGYDGDTHSVWAQRFDAVLTLAWPVGGAKAAHSAAIDYGPVVAPDHHGGAILAWRAYDVAFVSDIYAARLDLNGQPGTAGVPPAAGPARLALTAGPSPARAGGAVTLRLAMPAAGEARVTLLDVAGRRIAALRGTAGAPGTLAIRWDGRDESGRQLPSGLYFVRAEAGGRAALARIVVTD